ncbi:MAG: hypothetical protein ACQKBV_04805 [Puniceicoccales bacterium]
MNTLPRAEEVRQVRPRAASTQNPEHRLDHQSVIFGRTTSNQVFCITGFEPVCVNFRIIASVSLLIGLASLAYLIKLSIQFTTDPFTEEWMQQDINQWAMNTGDGSMKREELLNAYESKLYNQLNLVQSQVEPSRGRGHFFAEQ